LNIIHLKNKPDPNSNPTLTKRYCTKTILGKVLEEKKYENEKQNIGNKGEFRSGIVYILAPSQSERVNREIHKQTQTVTFEFLNIFHEIKICSSRRISPEIPRDDVLFIALLRRYRASNFALRKPKYCTLNSQRRNEIFC
jgi:hypothetical protein